MLTRDVPGEAGVLLWDRRRSTLHIADMTMFYAPASGGVRTYLEAKHRRLQLYSGVRHSLLVPGGDQCAQRRFVAGMPMPGKPGNTQHQPAQLELAGVGEQPDIAAVVAKTVELVTQQTIDIPRILVVPKGEVKSGFKPFTLDLSALIADHGLEFSIETDTAPVRACVQARLAHEGYKVEIQLTAAV